MKRLLLTLGLLAAANLGCALLTAEVACDADGDCPAPLVCADDGFCARVDEPEGPGPDGGPAPLPELDGGLLPTFTTISASSLEVLLGDTLTLRARVTALDEDGVGVGLGLVAFEVSSDSGATWSGLGAQPLDNAGEAALAYVANLDAVIFRARYLGEDERLEPSVSEPTDPLVVGLPEGVEPTFVAVTPAVTSLSLGETLDLTVVALTPDEAGEPVSVGSVTVEWSEDGGNWTVLESGNLDRFGELSAAFPADAAGQFQFRATYNGSELLAPSLSDPSEIVTVVSPTHTALAPLPAALEEGAQLELTANVRAPDDAGAPVTAGLVAFEASLDDGVSWAPVSSASLDATGAAFASFTPTDSGARYRARFEGTATFAASPSDPSEPVDLLTPTAVAIAASALSVDAGDTVTLTATVVDDQGAPVTSGQVVFDLSLDGGSGFTAIVTAALDGAGQATHDHIATLDGVVFRARFEGEGLLAPSTSAPTGPLEVIPPPDVLPTVTSLTRDRATASLGDTVTVDVLVETDAGGVVDAGSVDVEFRLDGGLWNTIGTAALNAAGTATVTHSAVGPGLLEYRALYTGAATFEASLSDPTPTVTVSSPTATTVSRSPGTVNSGSPVTITATVRAPNTSGGPVTTGTVTIQRSSDGGSFVNVGTGAVNASGQFVATHTPTTANSVVYRAIYNGVTLFETSTSGNTNAVTVRHLVTRTVEFTATWSRSYRGDGSLRDTPRCYQGRFDSTFENQRCAYGFDDAAIRAELAGATIVTTQIFLFYQHWFLSTGGTSRVGTHNSSNPQTTFGALAGKNVGRQTQVYTDRPQGRTFTLSNAIGRELRDGQSRGIILGPGADGNANPWYGYANGATEGQPARLRITYERFE